MRDITPATNFVHTLMQSPPDASACIAGGNNFPSISGLARFYATEYEGTLVEVEVFGLPNVATPGSSNFYGMHIHENGASTMHHLPDHRFPSLCLRVPDVFLVHTSVVPPLSPAIADSSQPVSRSKIHGIPSISVSPLPSLRSSGQNSMAPFRDIPAFYDFPWNHIAPNSRASSWSA